MDRLRVILAGANCDIVGLDENEVRFRHGTWLTQSATLLPKRGMFRLRSLNEHTEIRYEIHLVTAAQVWLTLLGVLFCWLVFPAVLAYRTIVYHPRRFAENILAGM